MTDTALPASLLAGSTRYPGFGNASAADVTPAVPLTSQTTAAA
jgi:hypothetical protein